MDFIEKILKEANLAADHEVFQKAGKFVAKVKELVSQFPNKFVSYNPDMDFAQVQVGKMTFQIFGKRSTETQRYGESMPAAYVARENLLNLYNIDINYDKQNKKLAIEFNENEVIHELTHFFDLKRSGEEGQKAQLKKLSPQFTDEYLTWTKKNNLDPDSPLVFQTWEAKTGKSVQKQRDYNEYVNDPYELNAHWMEHVMPQINNYISKTLVIPTAFEDFKNQVFTKALTDKNFKAYFNELSEKNKKKFLKRISVYYDQLKNFAAQDQNVDFNPNSTSLEIHKPILAKFFNKVKSIFDKEGKEKAA